MTAHDALLVIAGGVAHKVWMVVWAVGRHRTPVRKTVRQQFAPPPPRPKTKERRVPSVTEVG